MTRNIDSIIDVLGRLEPSASAAASPASSAFSWKNKSYEIMLVVGDLLSLFLLALASSASSDIVDLLGVDGSLALLCPRPSFLLSSARWAGAESSAWSACSSTSGWV